ncbi:TonB-dependent receptor [Galbibacter sp. EGI 63066]|uniref:TonB-dependent receptor n=1 Tax=Galbibacter sp. EGI 63066 TaxID=2993559 RepID=UPI0022492588|nr:TonB-dependent receptor [Galbibacter sp. EGI 63066]MCX2680917.1 TonB-dependent receptor [Galbibacter sp. EGI 63066]
MRKTKVCFCFLLSFLFGITFYGCYAQEKTPIKEVFSEIENQYGISISYIEDDMRGITLSSPSKDLTLDDLIAFINQHPLLECKKIADDQIAIKRSQQLERICGIVKDTESTFPLEGATITTRSGGSTITDENGRFELNDVSSNAILTISFLGYGKIIEKVSALVSKGSNCPEIYMKSISFELNEIILTNLFTSGLSKKADGSIEISNDDFGILPGMVNPDVLQTIQVLPGVESVNESVADINIRGGSHDQNLMLWDQIKMYHSGHFFGLISAFNPQVTKEVKIIKNGTSSQYTDGVSGTIIMKADDKVQKRFNGSVGSDFLSADFLTHIPLSDKLSLSLTGRRSFTDIYESPTYKNYFERSFQESELNNAEVDSESDFVFHDITSKLIYTPVDRHKLSLSFINVKNTLDYSETDESHNENRLSTLSQDNLGVGFSAISEWSDTFKTELHTYFSKYNLETEDRDLESDQSLKQENEVEETGIKFNTFTKLSDHFLWLNGYDYSETGTLNASYVINPTYEIIQKKVNRKHALYSEITYSGESNFLRAGMRLNYFERFGSFLAEPRLSFNQKLSSTFAFKIQGEFKHQTTTQFIDLNEDFLGVENRRWVNSDSNIPIVKSKQVSAGVDYKNNNWYVELNGFYKKTENLISESQGFNGQAQYDGHIGSAEIAGTEFLINKKLNQAHLWTSYTFSKQKYLFETLSDESFPGNFNVDHSFSAGMSFYFNEFWSISTGFIQKTGRPYTQPVAGEETVLDGNTTRVNYGETNAYNLPTYARLDFSTAFTFPFSEDSSLSVKAGILNVLNRENIISRYYTVDPEDDQNAVQVDRNALPLTPNIALRYMF